MVSKTIYENHVVTISNDNNRVGIGFIVEEVDEYYSILTCKHVVYGDDGYKDKLSIDGIKFTVKENENIVIGNDTDLALLTIDKIDGKGHVKLQEKVQDTDLTIATKYITDKDQPFTNIGAIVVEETSVDHNYKNNRAYNIKADETLEPGYSGSPVFDTNTHQVIGVLSLKKGDDSGYAICIKNIKKLTDKIDIETLQDDINLEYGNVARVVFDGSNNEYKITINQKSIFDEKEINIKEKQSDIVQEIKDYCKYIDDGQKREIEITKLELIIPSELYYENIGIWEDKSGENLVDEYEILIRSTLNQDIGKLIKSKIQSSWNIMLKENKELQELSFKMSGNRFKRVDSKVSVHLVDLIDENTPFDKITKNYKIAIWNNNCENSKKYSDFLSIMLQKSITNLPVEFRVLLADQEECSENYILMYDDPNTLPKPNYT